MGDFQLRYKQFSERSILVEWPSIIDKIVLEDLIIFKEKLEKSLLKEVVYIKSAYSSLLIVYKTTINNIYDKIQALKDLYSSRESVLIGPSLLWKIPVCYTDEFAIDIVEISHKKNLSKQDIITLHTQSVYTVFLIGFLPGFLYLGGLHKALHFLRKQTPRLQIKKGAVGIGGKQTGVYPCQGPGGWNVIGNSPINFFNLAKERPCFAKPGDRIAFYDISLKEHKDIYTLDQAGVYQLESEVIRG